MTQVAAAPPSPPGQTTSRDKARQTIYRFPGWLVRPLLGEVGSASAPTPIPRHAYFKRLRRLDRAFLKLLEAYGAQTGRELTDSWQPKLLGRPISGVTARARARLVGDWIESARRRGMIEATVRPSTSVKEWALTSVGQRRQRFAVAGITPGDFLKTVGALGVGKAVGLINFDSKHRSALLTGVAVVVGVSLYFVVLWLFAAAYRKSLTLAATLLLCEAELVPSLG